MRSASPAAPVPNPAALRRFWMANAVVSAAALSVLAYILVIRPRTGAVDGTGPDLSFMPAVNAALNACSAACLLAGYAFVKKGNTVAHRASMLGALAASALFLVGYLAYHFVHGDTRYPGTGPARTAYLLVLASHVVLSIPVVPMALAALYHALAGNFARHKRITRWLFPVWLYVSITGVAIFVMLRGALPG